MRVVAVVGATATGKTAVAETLADALDAEVVCADSRQIYRELEIGTGKPTPSERARRPHHLFDLHHLGERATAGGWARAAAACCATIAERGRTPLLVGGSGLYVRALQRGLAPTPPIDTVLRARLTEEVAAIGAPAMHERLAEVDPASAARLEPTDAQRVSRALEVWLSTGRRWSDWLAEPARPALDAAWRVIEVRLAGAPLAEWVTRRTHEWFEAGLVEETASLVHAGHGDALRALRAIGYDEAWALLEGTLDRASAEARTTLRTLQLAKRQRTWFRHQIDAVRLDAANPEIAEHALAAARG